MSKNIQQANDDNKTNWNTTVIIALFTMITAVTGSFFAFKGNSQDAYTSQISSLIASKDSDIASIKADMAILKDEVDKLKNESDRWRTEYIRVSLENFDLRSQLQTHLDDVQVMNQFIEDMPFAAGIKIQRQDGVFIGHALNEKFTAIFGLTKKQFIGFSDYDLFPKELAEKYQAGDRLVTETGREFREFIDIPTQTGELINSEYIKFNMKLPSGKKAIGFVIID